ncbi:TonB family protein [Aliikangiella marina]|nr:TonB family protein [Aliikangiella marina]
MKSKTSLLSVVLAVFILSFNYSVKAAEMTASLSDGDELSLIGIGMYQELRNDIYIGALFGPSSVTNVDQLKDDNVAKRMSIRFVSEYSNRKLARHWKERMAMNNPRNQWQPLTREIVGFSNLFKRRLVSGDEINIDHIPGVGTQIYLNKTLFTTVNKSGFANLLLNVWLGNIPPTKAFKSSIRGLDQDAIKTDFITKYTVMEPVKGRFDADLAPPTPATPVVTRVARAAPQQRAPARAEPKKAEPKKPEPKKEEPVQQVAQKQPAAKPPVTEKKDEAKPVQVAKAETKPEPKKPEPKKEPPKKVAKLTPPPVEEEPFIDADLIAGSYKRDLVNSIRQFQEYPARAYRQKKEGDVTAKVTLIRDGSVKEIELIERSGSRILDKAVTKMIRRAAPFQEIPSELEQEEFVFEVPISFTLN